MRRLLPLPVVDLDDLWELYALPAAPHLRLNLVQSLDGSLAVDGSSRPLSGVADRVGLRTLRAAADVVLVGAGTARAEDYGPIPLPEALRRRRLDEGRTPEPVLAVLTRDVRSLDPASRLLTGPPGRVVVVGGAGDVEVGQVLEQLREQHGPRVLCEGGPHLAQQVLDKDLLDELCLTIAPQLAGGGPRLLPTPLPGVRRLDLVSLVEHDGELLTRWSPASA